MTGGITQVEAMYVGSEAIRPSRGVWLPVWNTLYDLCGRDDFTLCVVGTTALTVLAFWLLNIFFIVLDVTGRPTSLTQYKVQSDKNAPLPLSSLRHAVLVGLRNQIFVGIPFVTVLYYAMRWRGCTFHPAQLPSWQQGLLEMMAYAVFQEIGFYYLHRLFHHPVLYKRFHKQHHEWTAPIGIAAIYAHPVEHATANLMPPVTGPLVMGSHLITLWAWFLLATVVTIFSHCGYHFPGCPSPEFHDFHHRKFNTNYGSLGVLDHLHGTDAMFQASEVKNRHKVFFSLTPISKQVDGESKGR